jgi:hypothetical protein
MFRTNINKMSHINKKTELRSQNRNCADIHIYITIYKKPLDDLGGPS